MSTIYAWAAEVSADTTGASGDWALVYDASTGRTKKVRLGALPFAGTMAFYGATAIDQPTLTPTAVTSLTAATVSAANSTGVYGFSSSTVAAAYAKRAAQIQADLDTLMQKINSTGLVAISGLS